MGKLATQILLVLLALTSCAGGSSEPEGRNPECLEIRFVGMEERERGYAGARFAVRNRWNEPVYVYGMMGPGNFFSTRRVNGGNQFMLPMGYMCGTGAQLFQVDPEDEFFLEVLLTDRTPDLIVEMTACDEAGVPYAVCQSQPFMNPIRDRQWD
ncbi:MAG: hypothetical protein ACI8QS_002531 [Planctomycetota bacterium]|jgi:hypothetical protein